jgi:hypothetical protein
MADLNFNFEANKPIMTVSVGVPPIFWKSGNQIKKMHWGQYCSLARRWRSAINSTIAIPAPDFTAEPKALWITRIYAGASNEYDVDNMVTACKPIIDALVKRKLLENDTTKYLPQGCLRADQKRGPSSCCLIRIYFVKGGS